MSVWCQYGVGNIEEKNCTGTAPGLHQKRLFSGLAIGGSEKKQFPGLLP